MKNNKSTQMSVLAIALIGALLLSDRAQAYESKQNRRDAMHAQDPKKFNLLWQGLDNVQKNAVLSAIEEHAEHNADAIDESAMRTYSDDLAQGHTARAVLVYLEELSASRQRNLLIHEAGLSEAQTEKIINAIGSKHEESSGELMMYNDRNFFSPLD